MRRAALFVDFDGRAQPMTRRAVRKRLLDIETAHDTNVLVEKGMLPPSSSEGVEASTADDGANDAKKARNE